MPSRRLNGGLPNKCRISLYKSLKPTRLLIGELDEQPAASHVAFLSAHRLRSGNFRDRRQDWLAHCRWMNYAGSEKRLFCDYSKEKFIVC